MLSEYLLENVVNVQWLTILGLLLAWHSIFCSYFKNEWLYITNIQICPFVEYFTYCSKYLLRYLCSIDKVFNCYFTILRMFCISIWLRFSIQSLFLLVPTTEQIILTIPWYLQTTTSTETENKDNSI